ncbi:MAG: GNAT family protein [Prolixibacteraceae bacterium]|jgi:ribosomal-protein-alanine N-acetyltransferase|nr:GNAT family protein [Prolixibacteraceae bacterium]
MQLSSQRLNLNEITIDDLLFLHEINSCPEVDEFNTLGIPENRTQTKTHLNKLIDAQSVNPRGSYNWILTEKISNEKIGVVGLNVSNNRFKLGEIYYNIHPKHWGNGFATEVGLCIIKFGFEVLKLHKIEAGVQTQNTKSIKVLEKLGMTREGLRRKILPIRGEWKDNYHYAIVEDDPL